MGKHIPNINLKKKYITMRVENFKRIIEHTGHEKNT